MNSLIVACIGCVIGIVGTLSCQSIFDSQKTWEIKYCAEHLLYENAESELKEALQNNQNLTDSLLQWKAKYEQASQENADAKTEIEILSHANKEMCEFLSTGIPDDLWIILFPKTDKPTYCTN